MILGEARLRDEQESALVSELAGKMNWILGPLGNIVFNARDAGLAPAKRASLGPNRFSISRKHPEVTA